MHTYITPPSAAHLRQTCADRFQRMLVHVCAGEHACMCKPIQSQGTLCRLSCVLVHPVRTWLASKIAIGSELGWLNLDVSGGDEFDNRRVKFLPHCMPAPDQGTLHAYMARMWGMIWYVYVESQGYDSLLSARATNQGSSHPCTHASRLSRHIDPHEQRNRLFLRSCKAAQYS